MEPITPTDEPTVKKPYLAPLLTVHGTVAQLTQGGAFGTGDTMAGAGDADIAVS